MIANDMSGSWIVFVILAKLLLTNKDRCMGKYSFQEDSENWMAKYHITRLHELSPRRNNALSTGVRQRFAVQMV